MSAPSSANAAGPSPMTARMATRAESGWEGSAAENPPRARAYPTTEPASACEIFRKNE